LRDQGKLGLDDRLEKYIPEIKIRSLQASNAEGRPITLRQIASHTAGLQREISIEGWNTLKFPSIEQLLTGLREVTTVFPPFSKYKYSNLGYTILGHVLSIIAGSKYEEYCKSSILEPLGMLHTGYDITEEAIRTSLAVGYTVSGEDTAIERTPYVDFGAMAPAAQLYSSVEDICRLVSLQFLDDDSLPLHTRIAITVNGRENIGESDHNPRVDHDNLSSNPPPRPVLDPGTIREMHTPVYIGRKWVGGTAIGWHIINTMGHTVSSHRGGIPGFTTDIVVVRDIKLGIAVFTNAFPQPNEIAVRLLEALVPYFETFTSIRNELETKWKLKTAGLFEKYEGKYHSKYYGDIEIKQLDGRLVITDPLAPPGFQTVLIPSGTDRFIMSGGDEDGEFAIFETAPDSTVIAVNTAGYRYELVSKK